MKNTMIAIGLLLAGSVAFAQQPKVQVWLTDPAANVFFQQQKMAAVSSEAGGAAVIDIDAAQRMQPIDGFGWALTGGSAGHIHNMSKPARVALLKELFTTAGNGIGGSYLRVSIGASDLDARVFSYNDLPPGETDTNMLRFDLKPDREHVIPVLKEILALYPGIKIMGSPWSPPVWMKTNGDTRGGSLKPEYYSAYAKYFVRYIQDMKKEGIVIDAITVQNEPLHPGNNPSLLMPAPEMGAFVRDHLGPAFKKAGIKTKIIIYDHNADKPDYPISILNDAAAKQYIDGSAFHLYGGKIEALTDVHNAHPDKNLYFTEQWVGGPGNMKRDIAEHIDKLIIGAVRNWCRTVIEWNLTSDPQYQPHTDRGGCNRCLGAVTISKDTVKRNPAYFIIAHAARFVRPGSVRVASTVTEQFPNVAFVTPAGKKVLIVLNKGTAAGSFQVKVGKQSFVASLSAGAVGTYVW